MYLLARQTNLRGLDSQKWAVDIGAAAAKGMGAEVGVWATVLSPGSGTVTWTSRWDDLSALEKGFADLTANTKYLKLAGEGAEFLNGPINDLLYEEVYAGNAPSNDATYVGTISAVCLTGNLARGMLSGIEIAQKAEKTTGVSTGFLAGQTGTYGSVLWLAGYKNIAEFEDAQHKLAADTALVEYLDGATTAYLADPTVSQSTLYMRIN